MLTNIGHNCGFIDLRILLENLFICWLINLISTVTCLTNRSRTTVWYCMQNRLNGNSMQHKYHFDILEIDVLKIMILIISCTEINCWHTNRFLLRLQQFDPKLAIIVSTHGILCLEIATVAFGLEQQISNPFSFERVLW